MANKLLLQPFPLATNDAAGLTNCNVFNGIASPRCDYINTLGTMTFAAGETSKSFSVAIIDDSYAEGTENFTVSLNNPLPFRAQRWAHSQPRP